MNLESTGKEPPDMDPDKLKIQTDSYELESDSNWFWETQSDPDIFKQIQTDSEN